MTLQGRSQKPSTTWENFWSFLSLSLMLLLSLFTANSSFFQQNATFKAHDFECDHDTAKEIVEKVNTILDLRNSPCRREYKTAKEKKLQSRRSFHTKHMSWFPDQNASQANCYWCSKGLSRTCARGARPSRCVLNTVDFHPTGSDDWCNTTVALSECLAWRREPCSCTY